MTSGETSSSPDSSGNNDDVHLDKPEEVFATIHSVKKQQQHIIEQLSEEQSKQEAKLNISWLYKLMYLSVYAWLEWLYKMTIIFEVAYILSDHESI